MRRPSLVLGIACCLVVTLAAADAFARGGGRAQGAGRGVGGANPRGSSRTGIGRLLRRGDTNAGSRTANAWEGLRDARERQTQIKQRREHLLDGERAQEQEALLATARQEAAGSHARVSDIR